jgi:pimeloyl-ACP methyl ester carboxylesterase
MGYSLGGHIAQAFTISHPEKVNRLILVASTCGGKDAANHLNLRNCKLML